MAIRVRVVEAIEVALRRGAGRVNVYVLRDDAEPDLWRWCFTEWANTLERRRFEYETDVARFGIDIWMTTTALVGGFRVCQSFLGAKIHDAKDPGADLTAMLVQVTGAR